METARTISPAVDNSRLALRIRRATEADAIEVATMVGEIAAHEGPGRPRPRRRRSVAHSGRRHHRPARPPNADSAAIGYVSAIRQLHLWTGGDVINLDDLYVRWVTGTAASVAASWAPSPLSPRPSSSSSAGAWRSTMSTRSGSTPASARPCDPRSSPGGRPSAYADLAADICWRRTPNPVSLPVRRRQTLTPRLARHSHRQGRSSTEHSGSPCCRRCPTRGGGKGGELGRLRGPSVARQRPAVSGWWVRTAVTTSSTAWLVWTAYCFSPEQPLVSGTVDDAPDAVGRGGALLLAGHSGLGVLAGGEDDEGLVAEVAQGRGLLAAAPPRGTRRRCCDAVSAWAMS